MMDDNRKIGTVLLILGFVFLFLGVLLFFDSALLAMGDILFLAGITLTIGVRRTLVFFFKKKQLRGNVCFFGGIFLVLMKWAFFGMILQAIGFLNLFGPFIPIAVSAMRTLPFIGDFLNLPVISPIVEKLAGESSAAAKRRERDRDRIPV